MKERRIELMIRMMDYLDPNIYDLSLMLVPTDKKYFSKLEKMANSRKNVHIIPPVPFQEISKFANNFDIGLYLLFPNCFNNEHALPNKFFEFVQSRLAIMIAPSVEMKSIVEKYDIGRVSKDFKPKSLASVIESMSREQIFECKNNCDKYARELSAETNIKKIRSIIDRIAS